MTPDLLARFLEPAEREAVLGDLAERGTGKFRAWRELLGLVVRRQAGMWTGWRPWTVLALLLLPCSIILSLESRFAADGSAVTLWMYFDNWDWKLLAYPAFRHDFPHFLGQVVYSFLVLLCWSWIVGFAIGAISRKTAVISAALFCFLLLLGQFLATPFFLRSILTGRNYHPNGPVFAVWFYRELLPPLVQIALVLLPSIWGIWQGSQLITFRPPAKAVLWTACALSAVPIAWIGVVWLEHFSNHAPVAVAFYNNLLAYHWLGLTVWWPILYWFAQAAGKLKEKFA